MATHPAPVPTPIYRIAHFDCLQVILTRGLLHAPNMTPADGLVYRTIHDATVQASRRSHPLPCGPGGTIHDYVPFYFGERSVMLYKISRGSVPGYTGGQEPIVYLVSSAQDVQASGAGFAFADGHGLANFTQWFDDLAHLNRIDWPLLASRYWNDTPQDNDRQRRKQAEFLVHGTVDWNLVTDIYVMNDNMKAKVEAVLQAFPNRHQPPVTVRRPFYY